jgi:hypothetical protein
VRLFSHAASPRSSELKRCPSAAVNVDRIGLEHTHSAGLSEDFHDVVAVLAKKVVQESLDGADLK